MAKTTTKSTSQKLEKKVSKSATTTPPAPVASSSSASSSSSDDDESDSSDDEPERAPKASAAPKAYPKFQIPKGMKVVMGKEVGALDWVEFNKNPDLELWAIRAPMEIKPRHLESLSLSLGTQSSSKPVGHFTAKKAEYDVYEAATRGEQGSEEVEARGGAEMEEFVPLLAKHSAGDKLYQAPRPISRNLIITRSLPSTILSHLPSSTSSLISSQPSPVPGAVLTAEELLDPEIVAAKKQKRAQPEGIDLKFRLQVGGRGPVGGKGLYHNPPPVKVVEEVEQEGAEGAQAEEIKMEVDENVDDREAKRVRKEAKKVKKGKRGEGDSPKKSSKKRKAEEE